MSACVHLTVRFTALSGPNAHKQIDTLNRCRLLYPLAGVCVPYNIVAFFLSTNVYLNANAQTLQWTHVEEVPIKLQKKCKSSAHALSRRIRKDFPTTFKSKVYSEGLRALILHLSLHGALISGSKSSPHTSSSDPHARRCLPKATFHSKSITPVT